MINIRIRGLKPDDMPKICELLRTRQELDEEGVQKRKILMEWCAFKNPFAGDEITYFIAEDQENIVAHIGRMPMKFIMNGELQNGYYIHDLYVHPEYRKKGMGFFLSMSLYKALEDNSDSFCVGPWHNSINLELHRKRGYRELCADKYVRIFNPSDKLKKIIKKDFAVKLLSAIGKSVLAVAEFCVRLYHYRNIKKTIKVNRFDFNFDNLAQRLSSKIRISPLKSSSYLNWKYIDLPYSKIEALAVNKEGRIAGFVVLGISSTVGYPEGTIIDISSDPEDKVSVCSLCKGALDYFKERKVSSVKCCLTDPRFIETFRKFFFIKVSGAYPFTIANINKAKDRNYMLNINNWHLTSGDSDGHMFEVDHIL